LLALICSHVLRSSDDEGSHLSEDRDLDDEFLGGYAAPHVFTRNHSLPYP
jgi:hypothetical protein